jgi:hypothetical protein
VAWRRRSSATEESLESVEVRSCARTRVIGGGMATRWDGVFDELNGRPRRRGRAVSDGGRVV